jgi:heptosyltransferase-1
MIKILIIRLSSLGDIIHTFPMVNDIKSNFNNVEIDWLVDDSFKELIKFNKNIKNIYSIALRKNKKDKFKIIKELVKLKKILEDTYYDYIIDSQGLIKSSILTRFIKGKSYGFSFFSIKEKLASFFYNNSIYVTKDIKATIRYRKLAQKIFKYDLDIKNNVNFGLNNNKDIKHNNLIIFFHATSDKNKKYPFSQTINLLNKILLNYKYNILLPYGNNKEYEESIKIKEHLINQELVIVPSQIYNYSDMYDMIKNSVFIIGVDTGLLHLSNALNKNLIALYVSTDPNKTGIIETENSVNLGGINLIPSSDEVFELFVKLLNK